ncbi:MAG: hypothetical protein H5T42_05705 [Methanothrix sp.]|jgi:hypothetical protein|uniref:Uncharacterized protein n=1 Tax=Methanothrix thermoacetophila (strain DSM 6194 / JCM 14653 / NBRC 101360 / PT) TaxID=349307 RepID=A0B5A3_METTP|nr:hypothetical protein [Methanothrix thermoacetophila]ABK13877.1 hypothetical protein Mthe_0075 [Methanothrix thermoacetophila PT]MBC7079948.1 hypothetical protein [Methanothrix sp.]
MKASALIALCILFVGLSSSFPVPVNYAAGQDPRFSESLFIVSGGSALSESYTSVERLERFTEVRTSYSGTPSPQQSMLEANIRSNVIGSAHIGWLSADSRGVYGRSIEDLTGVFSIEKFIQLWNNSTAGEISVDWMPCI